MNEFKLKLKAMVKDKDSQLTATELRQGAKFQREFDKQAKKKVLE